MSKKGTALFIVLATVLVVVILTNIILNIVSSQTRLTHHQVSRIKAYYAAQAGMVYALEKLRTGVWVPPATGSNYACLEPSTSTADCIDPGVSPTTAAYRVKPFDADIPYKIQITISPYSTTNPKSTAKLDIKTDYTYQ